MYKNNFVRSAKVFSYKVILFFTFYGCFDDETTTTTTTGKISKEKLDAIKSKLDEICDSKPDDSWSCGVEKDAIVGSSPNIFFFNSKTTNTTSDITFEKFASHVDTLDKERDKFQIDRDSKKTPEIGKIGNEAEKIVKLGDETLVEKEWKDNNKEDIYKKWKDLVGKARALQNLCNDAIKDAQEPKTVKS